MKNIFLALSLATCIISSHASDDRHILEDSVNSKCVPPKFDRLYSEQIPSPLPWDFDLSNKDIDLGVYEGKKLEDIAKLTAPLPAFAPSLSGPMFEALPEAHKQPPLSPKNQLPADDLQFHLELNDIYVVEQKPPTKDNILKF